MGHGNSCKMSEVWRSGVGGKNSTLRWFGRMERKKSEEFVKKVYVSEKLDPRRRGRPIKICTIENAKIFRRTCSKI